MSEGSVDAKMAGPALHEPPLERPIQNEEQDRFGRAGFVRRVANSLIGRDGKKARGVIVGIVGPWGSGKSSVLNLLANELERRNPKPVVVRFDPWLVSGRDDLILALLSEMHAALAAAPGLQEKAKEFLDKASPYISVLGRVGGLFLPGLGGTVDNGVEAIQKRLTAPGTLQKLKAAVAQSLLEASVPIVILIDELDRLRDDEVRTIAQLVRAVADFPHVSYVLAYDQRRVEEALGSDLPGELNERRERGRSYLEKLVHIPIPLPSAVAIEIKKLLLSEISAVFAENGLSTAKFQSERGQRLIFMLSEEILTTPREVLRATSVFRVLAGMVGEEVETLDLIALSVLQTRFPELYQPIRNSPDFFVPNLLTKTGVSRWSELQTEKDIPLRLKTRFPGVRIEEAGQSLLSFLFPQVFDQLHQMDGDDADGNTIRNRRAFGIALRLGLPPGTVSRSEIERLFLGSELRVSLSLQLAVQTDTLSDLLDRAAELYPLIDEPSDDFWPAASKFFHRSRKVWEPHSEQIRWQIDSIARLASARLRIRPNEIIRFVKIAEFLGVAMDPHILPLWLQRHILRFGLFGKKPQESLAGTTFLNSDQLAAALAFQADWVAYKFCKGDLLFELHHPLVLHQLFDAGRWDANCNAAMQFFLEDRDGLDGVASLFFGGGYSTEPASFRRFVDFGSYSKRVHQRMSEIEGNESYAPLRAAFRKSLGELF
ncbi:MAG: AAA family ATPase [Roseomonas sp.]|nr:AAA family ATPase [Roseomonas sp.]